MIRKIALFALLAAAPVMAQDAASSVGALVRDYRNSLVLIESPLGKGSGFVCNIRGSTFLVSNAHVLAGARGPIFKTLDGAKITVGAGAVAVGHDVARLAVGAAQRPFEMMDGVDNAASIGDEIVVLGNSEGAGVIAPIRGKIVGLGPNLVEVDAPFVPGNSGSPIVHVNSGKAIGVATYLTVNRTEAGTQIQLREPVVRRFGYRLDSVATWQPVAWPAFYAQADELQRIEAFTGDLVRVLQDLGKNHTLSPGVHTHPAISRRIDEWRSIAMRRGTSPRDLQSADQNILSFLKVACQSDITAARPRISYDFFQRALVKEEAERKSMAEVFTKIIAEMRKSP